MSRPWLGCRGERHPATKVADADRHAAIRRVVDGREPLKAVAQDLGVRETTVAFWIRQAGYVRGYVPRRRAGAPVVGWSGSAGSYDPGVREKGGDLSRPASPGLRVP